MTVSNFIQQNSLWLTIACVVLIICLISMIKTFNSKNHLSPIIEKDDPDTNQNQEDSEKKVNPSTNTPDDITKEIKYDKQKLEKLKEAKEWWNTLTPQDKKLYTYDAQFKKPVSRLNKTEVLFVYNVFLENQTITTK